MTRAPHLEDLTTAVRVRLESMVGRPEPDPVHEELVLAPTGDSDRRVAALVLWGNCFSFRKRTQPQGGIRPASKQEAHRPYERFESAPCKGQGASSTSGSVHHLPPLVLPLLSLCKVSLCRQ